MVAIALPRPVVRPARTRTRAHRGEKPEIARTLAQNGVGQRTRKRGLRLIILLVLVLASAGIAMWLVWRQRRGERLPEHLSEGFSEPEPIPAFEVGENMTDAPAVTRTAPADSDADSAGAEVAPPRVAIAPPIHPRETSEERSSEGGVPTPQPFRPPLMRPAIPDSGRVQLPS